MTDDPKDGVRTVAGLARQARDSARALAGASPDRRDALLHAIADALEAKSTRSTLFEANQVDVSDAVQTGDRRVHRLRLDEAKLDTLVAGLRSLAATRDRVGEVTLIRELDDGLTLQRATCPLGVVGVIFEARPDAVPQIAGLALRTGNGVILKGGSEARHSNRALHQVLQDSLVACGFDRHAVALIDARADVQALLQCERVVDLIVARGSSALVEMVERDSRIPVLGHAEGLCHLYVHRSADPEMAARIAVDAKCSYPAACNSIETLLWEVGAEPALDRVVDELTRRGVSLRGCANTRAIHPTMETASEVDWQTEYGDLTLSILQVSSLDHALEHIERYGSRHTEAIVATNEAAIESFTAGVDAASVFVNASTRFADGYRYGFGAELGISTSKLHARGPVGCEGLLTYRWLLRGEGHCADDYGPGKRAFRHVDRPVNEN